MLIEYYNLTKFIFANFTIIYKYNRGGPMPQIIATSGNVT